VSEKELQLHQIIQLEVRPDKKDTPSFKMLVEALLSAAREELAWEAEEQRSEAS
jgi:hypothetical protein